MLMQRMCCSGLDYHLRLIYIWLVYTWGAMEHLYSWERKFSILGTILAPCVGSSACKLKLLCLIRRVAPSSSGLKRSRTQAANARRQAEAGANHICADLRCTLPLTSRSLFLSMTAYPSIMGPTWGCMWESGAGSNRCRETGACYGRSISSY